MKTGRLKKNILFILFLIVVIAIATIIFLFIKKINPLEKIVEEVGSLSTERKNDNHNGVYGYGEKYGTPVNAYSGCTITKVNFYIAVVDDNFYLYRNTCLSSELIDSGKTKDLNINYDDVENDYRLTYKKNIYKKISSMKMLSVYDNLDKIKHINLSSYRTLFRYISENVSSKMMEKLEIYGINIKLFLTLNYSNGLYTVMVIDEYGTASYQYTASNYNDLPELYNYGDNIVVVEKGSNETNTKYAHSFKVIAEKGIVYNLTDKLPININERELGRTDSIFITYDNSSQRFKLFIGDDKKMCVNNSDSNEPSFYEFDLAYNYIDKGFAAPEFKKIHYKNEGCRYISNFMEE